MAEWISDELLVQSCAAVLMAGGIVTAFSRKIAWIGIGIQCLVVFLTSLRFAIEYSSTIILVLALSSLVPMVLQDRSQEQKAAKVTEQWPNKTEKIIVSVGLVALLILAVFGYGPDLDVHGSAGLMDAALLLPTVFFVVSVIYSINLLRGKKNESP